MKKPDGTPGRDAPTIARPFPQEPVLPDRTLAETFAVAATDEEVAERVGRTMGRLLPPPPRWGRL